MADVYVQELTDYSETNTPSYININSQSASSVLSHKEMNVDQKSANNDTAISG